MTILNSISQHFAKAEILAYDCLHSTVRGRSNSQSVSNTINASPGERFGFTMIFVVPAKALAHRMPAHQSRFNQPIPKQL